MHLGTFMVSQILLYERITTCERIVVRYCHVNTGSKKGYDDATSAEERHVALIDDQITDKIKKVPTKDKGGPPSGPQKNKNQTSHECYFVRMIFTWPLFMVFDQSRVLVLIF